MRIQQLPVAGALQSLNSGPQGLSCDEVTHRLHEFGPNEMIPVRRESVLLRVLKEFTQFLSLMLWFCAGLALLAGNARW
jgi:magnesium-transporting ATPase (P-type)